MTANGRIEINPEKCCTRTTELHRNRNKKQERCRMDSARVVEDL